MAKNFNNYMPEDTDPEEAQRRADAWGVNIDDHVFANADEYLESDREVLTENEYGTENVFDELDNGGAPEQESIYAGHSLKEMIEVLRDAEAHSDKSTSFEVQAALQTYLEKAIEKGELTDDGALNLIDQIDRMTKASGDTSGEGSPANATDTSGGAPRTVSPENIVNLQNTAKENWAKTPNAPAATPESPVRQAFPSAEDIDAARRASGETATPETPDTPENPKVPAASSETEPAVDDKEKSKEKRMSKIRRGFNRALGWLMAEKKDNGSSEDETKTDEEAATQPTTPKATSMFAGVRKPFADMSAERRAKRAARAEGDAVEGDSAAVEEGEKAPEPTEADKAAAAAAVKADTGPTQKVS